MHYDSLERARGGPYIYIYIYIHIYIVRETLHCCRPQKLLPPENRSRAGIMPPDCGVSQRCASTHNEDFKGVEAKQLALCIILVVSTFHSCCLESFNLAAPLLERPGGDSPGCVDGFLVMRKSCSDHLWLTRTETPQPTTPV